MDWMNMLKNIEESIESDKQKAMKQKTHKKKQIKQETQEKNGKEEKYNHENDPSTSSKPSELAFTATS